MRDHPFTDKTHGAGGWQGYTHSNGEQPGTEALRLQIEQRIEAVRAEIEERIADLKRSQHETELSDQIGALEGQLSFLDAQMMQANSATLASLIAIQTALPRTMSATAQATSQTMAHATAEAAHHIVEMTSDKIASMDRFYEAEAAQFRAYEQQSFSRMEHLAAANGVDITSYRTARATFQADYERAKANGDEIGMAAADYGLAINNLAGKRTAGADASETERDLDEAAKARARLQFEIEKSALAEGRKKGLTGADLRAYVDAETTARLEEEDKRTVDTMVASGVPKEEAVATVVEVAERAEARDRNANERTATTPTQDATPEQTVEADRSATETDRAGFDVGTLGSIGGGSMDMPSKLEVAEASVEEDKAPSASPVLTSQQMERGI